MGIGPTDNVDESLDLDDTICDQVRDESSFSNLNIGDEEISKSDRKKLKDLVEEYDDVFAKHEFDLGHYTKIKHKIELTDTTPISCRQFKVNPVAQQEIDRQVTELLEAGVIRPSTSSFSTNCILVRKPKGGWRAVFDYRRVNKVTKKVEAPMPAIHDVLECLGGAKYFSSMDIASGFSQIEMEEESKQYTAFVCRLGQFEWNRMSQGLVSAPQTFVRSMNEVFRGMNWISVIIYIDDLMCWSRDIPDHLLKLRKIFQRLRESNLKLKLQKCEFLKKEMEWLGHHISGEGIRPSELKVKVVRDQPPPTNKKELRAILGFFGFYRKFVKDYAKISQPLNDLLKKDSKFMNNADQLSNALGTRSPLNQYWPFPSGISHSSCIQTAVCSL